MDEVSLMATQAQNPGFEIQEDDVEVIIRQPGQDSARTRADPESGEVASSHTQARDGQHLRPADEAVSDRREDRTRVRWLLVYHHYYCISQLILNIKGSSV